jgi:hypothetical protein
LPGVALPAPHPDIDVGRIKRAYILAGNKLAEKAGWDKQILAIELQCARNGGQQRTTLTDVSPPASDGTLYVCALHPKRGGGSVVGLATGWLCSSGATP